MIACSREAVSPWESTVEETNGRDDVDWVGVLRDLENNGRPKMLNLLEDLDCWELGELSFAMSIRAREKKRWRLSARALSVELLRYVGG